MAALPNCKDAVEQHRSLYYQLIKPQMAKIRHAQELAERMANRKHDTAGRSTTGPGRDLHEQSSCSI
eukprot:10860770-Karenia_brevis.AAC.1